MKRLREAEGISELTARASGWPASGFWPHGHLPVCTGSHRKVWGALLRQVLLSWDFSEPVKH